LKLDLNCIHDLTPTQEPGLRLGSSKVSPFRALKDLHALMCIDNGAPQPQPRAVLRRIPRASGQLKIGSSTMPWFGLFLETVALIVLLVKISL
jgi:hypothetical protein